MGFMPRLCTPPQMPDAVQEIIEVIGNQARTEMLRSLADGSITDVDLAESLSVAQSSICRNLVTLEHIGLVAIDVEAGRRQGDKTVTWSLVPDKVDELCQEWAGYVTRR